MATIYPFRAIRPNPLYAGQLVFTAPQVESVSWKVSAAGNLAPLKDQLENAARIRPETPEGQERAYANIKKTLTELMDAARLYRELRAGIYVYEIEMPNYRQAGIWTLTAVSDYMQGRIKTHEHTLTDSVRRIYNYREQTGLEGNPVLLTYSPSVAINRIIAETQKNGEKVSLGSKMGFHRIWKIENKITQRKLISAFAAIKDVYMADGHHRLASAAKLLAFQRENNLPLFDKISSLYIASDQLRLQEFDRLFLPDKPLDQEFFFQRLSTHFTVSKVVFTKAVKPNKPNKMGMYAFGEWHYILPRSIPATVEGCIDAAILQEQLLEPVFGIKDPQTDPRLKCIGGERALEEIADQLLVRPDAIVFTLFPLNVQLLMSVADARKNLPPKSTWIEPKVPYGLLLYQNS
ncbi:DUF1015 family protein [Mucilaginibacter sp. UYCu711]|uniref:DUF1015 family protein n=1 Tax=Mucilaginibacter sp. UYCu711 TaxID=3156339 RepID=UPI003D203CA0